MLQSKSIEFAMRISIELLIFINHGGISKSVLTFLIDQTDIRRYHTDGMRMVVGSKCVD